jgi:hypothetical protein
VYVGGLALVNPPTVTDEVDFVRRMYAHRPDLVGKVDGIGLHPYQATVGDTYMRLAKFRQGINAIVGAAMPIEITEVGWATTAVSDSERGADLSALAQTLPRSDCNVDRFIPYTWITEEQNGSDSEQWFGIANADGSVKPSGQGYLNAVQSMRGASAPAGTLTICHQPVSTAPISSLPPSTGPNAGPRLILSVRQDRRHAQLRISGKCPKGCRLRIDLMKGRAETASVRLATKRTPFSSRRQVVRLRLPRGLGRNAKLVVVATGKTGGRTTRTRGLHMH